MRVEHTCVHITYLVSRKGKKKMWHQCDRICDEFRWTRIGKMASKVRFNREFSCELASCRCNPGTWRRHIALSSDLWDSIFNMIVSWEVRERAKTISEGGTYFKLDDFLPGKGPGDRLCSRSTISHKAIWPIRQFTKRPGELLKREFMLRELFYFTTANRLPHNLWYDKSNSVWFYNNKRREREKKKKDYKVEN